MDGYGSPLSGFLNSSSNAAKAAFSFMAQAAQGTKTVVEQGAHTAMAYAEEKWNVVEQKVKRNAVAAKEAVERKLAPQPSGKPILPCPKNRKAERVAERREKITQSKEKLKALPTGKQRDALSQATERFERNNVAVERARLANDAYSVGQGDPPEGWDRVGPEELKKLGMTRDQFPQLAKDFRPSLYTDGYYPELYKSKPDVFGEVRYVLSFRGTQGIKDGATDALQAFGHETDHYSRAIKTAQALKRVFGDSLDITGHSLGAGMAIAAGLVTGSPTYAIDAAGVHPATVERFGVPYDPTLTQKIHNYIAEGEVLDWIQNPDCQRAIVAGLYSVSPTGAAALAAAGGRAVIENGTVTYGVVGQVHRIPVMVNAGEVLEGKTTQGLTPGMAARINNKLNPLQKVQLHNPKYVIAGIEQQKADDLHAIERNIDK